MNPLTSLSAERIQELLVPFHVPVSREFADQLKVYLDLLLRWNAKTNLTAIRDPEQMVQRHFGESLFAASQLPAGGGTLLDIGSGAGFPGLPIALSRPAWHVTLAESQGKKAAFLQEAVRKLGVDVQIWPRRVEQLPADRRFTAVTLRAVDESARALSEARARVLEGGWLVHLTSRTGVQEGASEEIAVPGALRRVLRMEHLG